MAARLDDPHHLFDALRHVWKRHNAELGSRYVEAIISELECVAIHDTCLDFEPLLARSHTEQVEHDGDWSVAITSALRRAAGIPRAPLSAATSRNRMPARSSAGRRPSFPSYICVGVLVLS